MMRHRILGAAAVAALVVGGVSANSRAQKKVELLDAGSGSQQELRYATQTGAAQNLEVSVKQSMEVHQGGQQQRAREMPVIGMTWAVEPTAVQDDGSAELTVTITGASVAGEGQQAQQASQQVQQLFKGAEATLTVGPRGHVQEGPSVQLPEGAQAQAKQMIEQPLRGLVVLLPSEPVGEGAQWRTTEQRQMQLMQNRQMSATHVNTYTLQDVGEETLTMEVAVTSTQEGADEQAGQFSVEGEDQKTIDLEKMMPVSLSTRRTQTIQVSAGGQQTRVKMQSDVSMEETSNE